MKLYLVRNEAKTECVGFVDYAEAYYASTGDKGEVYTEYLAIAEKWLEFYGDEECTITEIEV